MASSPFTADTVQAFIAAPKQATATTNGAQLKWQPSGFDSAVAVVTVESDGEANAALRIVAGYDSWPHWNFLLQWHDEQVYGWHFKKSVAHSNTNCPPEFPRKVRDPHEHVWVENHDLTCALALTQFVSKSPADLKTCLAAFCGRINLTLEPAYVPPPVGDQMSILPEPR